MGQNWQRLEKTGAINSKNQEFGDASRLEPQRQLLDQRTIDETTKQ
jgi:hypothetical protein